MSSNYWLGRGRLSRRRLIHGAGIGAAGLASAAIIGCGDDDDDGATPGTPAPGTPTDDTPTNGEGRQGGRFGITVGINSPNFNPVTNWTEGNWLSGIHVYDRLLSPRMDDRVYVLEAAESVELPDETTVVFKLNPGMVYEDRAPVNGREVVGEDIVEFQYYCRDEDQAENNAFQNGSMESVESPDDGTVVFNLQRPNAYLFSGTQLGQPANQVIVPRELIENLETTQPLGSGPYRMIEHQLDTRYLYARSDTYRQAGEGKPYIDEREVFLITDIASAEAAFRGEQVHVWAAPIDIAERLIADLGDQLVVEEYESLSPFTWMASRDREPWTDIRAREALYRLFNPQPYIDLVDNGHAVPATGPLAGGLTAYQLDPSESEQYLRFDLGEARQLLEAAGFDFNHNYDLITLGGGGGGRNDLAVQVWQQQLEAAGMRTTLSALPFSEWLGPRLGTGNYDFNLNAHPAYDTPQTPLRFHHTDPQHIIRNSNLANPEVDAMIEESEITLDRDANIDLVKRIQLAVLENYAPFAQVNSNILKQPRWAYVRDYEFTPATHPMYRTEAWLDL